MSHVYYRYNPETLSYETILIPLKVRIRRFCIFALIYLLCAVAIIYFYNQYFLLPKTVWLSHQNEVLKTTLSYELHRLLNIDVELNSITQRDNIFRSVFEAEPIPNWLREVGLGKNQYYQELAQETGDALSAQSLMLFDRIRKKMYIQTKSFDEITFLVRNKEYMILSIPTMPPVNFSLPSVFLSCAFGYRIDPIYKNRRFHEGIDLAGPKGTAIYASGQGEVIQATYTTGGYGKVIVVDHGFGYKSRYAHLDKINVVQGQKIKRGELIAEMGSTGKSTGPHLHFEILLRNHPENPVNYITMDMTEEQFEKATTLKSGGGTDLYE